MYIEGWVYDRYLLEAQKIDVEVQEKQTEVNNLGEIQMNAMREAVNTIKVFTLHAGDVVAQLLPVFDEKNVFKQQILKGDLESIKAAQEKLLLDKPFNAEESNLMIKQQVLQATLPPSGLIHYFKWGSKDVY